VVFWFFFLGSFFFLWVFVWFSVSLHYINLKQP
jgi:hypothetical protein